MHVIKRKGHKEKYDEKKVYASVYSACIICDLSEKKSEKVADEVTKEITKLVNKNKIKNSKEIFEAAAGMLKKHNEDVAFMYETHRDIS